MDKHALYALAHPVFDPMKQITKRHFWQAADISCGLTVNIGME